MITVPHTGCFGDVVNGWGSESHIEPWEGWFEPGPSKESNSELKRFGCLRT